MEEWKSEHKGSECKHVGLEYEHVGSAEEYVDSDMSTRALQEEWGALEKGTCVYSAV